MFSDKDIADGANADPSFGSAAVATAVIVTAATDADKKPVENSAGQLISVTDELMKQSWIKGIVSEPIVFA